MTLMRKLAGAVVLVSVAGVLLAQPAMATPPPDPKVKVSKRADGPFVGNFLAVNVQEPRSLYVRVKNPANERVEIGIRESTLGDNLDYIMAWFRKDTEITNWVQGPDGYQFELKPDRSRLFRVRVRLDVDDPDPMCLFADVIDPAGFELANGSFGINGSNCN
jgi:hypothetical protein